MQLRKVLKNSHVLTSVTEPQARQLHIRMTNPYRELNQEHKEKLLHSVKSRLALISSYTDDVLPVRPFLI
jgi:hypothetical protein